VIKERKKRERERKTERGRNEERYMWKKRKKVREQRGERKLLLSSMDLSTLALSPRRY